MERRLSNIRKKNGFFVQIYGSYVRHCFKFCLKKSNFLYKSKQNTFTAYGIDYKLKTLKFLFETLIGLLSNIE